MMARVSTHRRKRILGHTRDYIARLGSRQEAMQQVRERRVEQVEEVVEYRGRLDVDFLVDNASMFTIQAPAGQRDLGDYLAELVGAEREGGYWPDMRLDVRMTIEVLNPPSFVADQLLGD